MTDPIAARGALATAVENVRHRGIQKRVTRSQPDVPKRVAADGIDWQPCGNCRDEATLILTELAEAGYAVESRHD